MCCGGLTEPLRLRTGHLDCRVEINPKLFTPDRIARANHKAVAEPLRISDDERLREDDHFCAGGSGFSDQTNCLVNTGFRIEWHCCRLHYGNLNRCLFLR